MTMTRMLFCCLVVLSLIFSTFTPSHESLPDEDYSAALWIASSEGLLKVNTSGESSLLEVPIIDTVSAITVDLNSGHPWAISGSQLLSFDTAGNPLISVDIHAATGTSFSASKVKELVVNPHDDQIWLAVDNVLYRFTIFGQFISTFTFSNSIQALTLEPDSSNIWLASGESIYRILPDGTIDTEFSLNSQSEAIDIVYDKSLNQIWIALSNTLKGFNIDGAEVYEKPFSGIELLAIAPEKGLWVSAGKNIAYLDFSTSTWTNEIVLSDSDNANTVALTVGQGGSAWLGNHKVALNLQSTEQLIDDGEPVNNLTEQSLIMNKVYMPSNLKLFNLAVYHDAVPPLIEISAPTNGELVQSLTPTIELTFSDTGLGVDEQTLKIFLDDVELNVTCEGDATVHTCIPTESITEGQYELKATVSDFAGNESVPSLVTFTVMPVDFITITSETLTNQPTYTLAGRLYSTATLTVNGVQATVDSSNHFTALVSLQEGVNTLALEAATGTTNYQLDAYIELDTTPPNVDQDLIHVGTEGGAVIVVQGETASVEPDATVEVTNTSTGAIVVVTADSGGSFSTSIAGAVDDVLTIRVLDQLGNTASPFNKVVADISAPPLDPTQVSTVFDATEFIYSGISPVQQGVAPGTIQPEQASPIRGTVKNVSGQPLSGVRVSIHNHPEFGYTFTRSQGEFDLVINGGSHFTLSYEKQGYFPVHRLIEANWQRYSIADEVVMLQPAQTGSLVDLTSSAPMQVAIGGNVTDSDGTRHSTVMFSQGTTAEMELADGTRQALTSFTLRMTEFTEGEGVKQRLPASLPENISDGSVTDFSIDEALAAGAKSVHFSKPVSVYTNNFLEMPVGTLVPLAYYDRQDAAWIGSQNGVIIQILSISQGIAELDVDGSGIAADATTLADLNITDVERQQLAVLYNVGESLWRIQVSHFSALALACFPYGLPDGASGPDLQKPFQEEPESCQQEGSIIECQNQILGKTISLTGSPFKLNYRNNRTEGRKANYKITIPLTEENIDPLVKQIQLKIEVAGQIQHHFFIPEANQSYNFEWDGKDAFGRTVYGAQKVSAHIGYVYQGQYMDDVMDRLKSFGELPKSVSYATAIKERAKFVLWQKMDFDVIRHQPEPAGLGSWTLDVHHNYDPVGQILYLGDGSRRAAADRNRIINTVAGNGSDGYTGDDGKATDATLAFPHAIDVAPNGDLYIVDRSADVIRKVDGNGVITTVAGNGTYGFSGDGGLAVNAQLNAPEGVAVHPDGTIYISDGGNNRIRKVDPEGVITTYAGTGVWGYSGDGGPAIDAMFNWPQNIKLGKDGSLYIADYWNYSIRRVSPEGIITTVAGGDNWDTSVNIADGILATLQSLDFPQVATPDNHGNLLIADTVRAMVHKVSPEGILNSFTGVEWECGHSEDGGQAKNNHICDPYDIEVDQQGNVYIVVLDYHCIKKISTDGVISTFAGKCGADGYSGDGGYARNARMYAPWSVAVAPDGSVYIAEPYNNVVHRVHQSFPMFDSEDLAIASSNGDELYQFDQTGRHLKTWNTTTAEVIYEFFYDDNGRLSQIIDHDNKITSIQRNALGEPISITAPHGQVTSLLVDPNGYLSSITNPLDEANQFAYTADGLMNSYTDPRLNITTFSYDSDGRLTTDQNPALGGWTLQRSNTSQGHQVMMTTAEGRELKYQVDHLPTGDKQWINTNKDGTTTTSIFKADGETVTTMPDGTIVSNRKLPDPRFLMERPARAVTTKTPGGLSYSTTETRTATLSDPDNSFSHSQLSETNDVNGRITTSVFDTATLTWTFTSPEGRQAQLQMDAANRPVTLTIPGVEPVTYSYNTYGYLSAINQGSRSTVYSYYESGYQSGFLESELDAAGRTSTFDYLANGQVSSASLPGNRTMSLNYDANQNTTGITPPGKPEHSYDYNNVDLVSSYTPPSVASIDTPSTQYQYNLDKQLELTTLPDANVLEHQYDPGSGKLTALTIPRGQYQYSYNVTTGLLEDITAPDTGNLSYQYDGRLLLSSTWSGEVAGSVSQTYNNDFVVTERQVNGLDPVSFGYDNDLLLTSAGSLAISRDLLNGRITGTTLGSMITSRAYTNYGELNNVNASFGTNALYGASYTYDNLGRITSKTEIVDGVTQILAYSYELSGRLVEVKTNGITTEAYSYDLNGNRLSATVGGVTVNGIYDAQDRLSQYGNLSYTYNDNGDVTSVTDSATTETTQYNFDVLGNLISVTQPDLTQIEYVIDGKNRRIGKKVNGTLVQGFLYKDQLNPIAELDGQSNVVSRFIYGTKPFVPDYMLNGGKTYRIVSDHLGSVRLVVDMVTGSIAQRIDYDSFGNIINDTNPAFQPFGFAGGLYDEHTDHVRFGAREYAPNLGRWLTKDPIRHDGGVNLYAYSYGNPQRFIDPDGQIPIPVIYGLAAIGTYGIYKTFQEGLRSVEKALDSRDKRNKAYEKMMECIYSKPCTQAEYQAYCNDYYENELGAYKNAADSVSAFSKFPGTSTGGPLPSSIDDLAQSAVMNEILEE